MEDKEVLENYAKLLENVSKLPFLLVSTDAQEIMGTIQARVARDARLLREMISEML